MHTCAVLVRGDVYCWGFNYYGQLGSGDTDFHHDIVSVVGLQEGGPSMLHLNSDVIYCGPGR